MERGIWRRAGYRYGSKYGGCYERGIVDWNGRCFGTGNRCCYGRQHESRCGSKTGSRSDRKTGCRSWCRCSAGTRRCWGSSTGGRCEGRTRGRSGCRCSGRNGCCFRGWAGRMNEGRFGGKDSPYRPGNGMLMESSQRPKGKSQSAKRRNRQCENDLAVTIRRWTKGPSARGLERTIPVARARNRTYHM
jgi:hypothetical protein